MKTKCVRMTLLTLAILVAARSAVAQQASPAEIPLSTAKTISTPDKLDTPIGKLNFSDGVPTGNTSNPYMTISTAHVASGLSR